MRLLTMHILIAAMLTAGAEVAQTPQQITTPGQAIGANAVPSFEVATIKPSDPANCCARTWGLQGRKLSTNNTYLQWLIKWAYGLQDKQIVGGPEWMGVDRYDIAAQSAGAQTLTAKEARTAMRKLLADRFQLKFHHETREIPAYVLTVARGGTKLTKSDPAVDTEPTLGFSGAVGETMHGFGRDATLGEFMGEVQRLALDRPVVDRTGITGTYNFDFQFTREGLNSLGMTELPDDAPPNLLTALNQQLGLQMVVEKAAVDVIVVDGAERPSAN